MAKIYRAPELVSIGSVVQLVEPLDEGGTIEAVVDPAQSIPTYEFHGVDAYIAAQLVRKDWNVYAFDVECHEDFGARDCRLPYVIEALHGAGRLFVHCELYGSFKHPLVITVSFEIESTLLSVSIPPGFSIEKHREMVHLIFATLSSAFNIPMEAHQDRFVFSGPPGCLITDDPIYNYYFNQALMVPRAQVYPKFTTFLNELGSIEKRSLLWYSAMVLPDREEMDGNQALSRTLHAAQGRSVDLSLTVSFPRWNELEAVRLLMAPGQSFQHPVASFGPSKDGKGCLNVRIEPEGFRWELVWTKDIPDSKMQEIRQLTGIPPLVPFAKPPAKRRKPWSRATR